MDRNGKKAKAQPADGAQHAERSDMKGNRRDAMGAPAETAGKRKAGEPAAPPRQGGKGGRR